MSTPHIRLAALLGDPESVDMVFQAARSASWGLGDALDLAIELAKMGVPAIDMAPALTAVARIAELGGNRTAAVEFVGTLCATTAVTGPEIEVAARALARVAGRL